MHSREPRRVTAAQARTITFKLGFVRSTWLNSGLCQYDGGRASGGVAVTFS